MRAAPFAYVVPVAAVAGPALFLDERPGLNQILGGAVALAGAWLVARAPEQARTGVASRPEEALARN